MRRPALLVLLLVPAAAVRAGVEDLQGDAEGLAEASGGWDEKADKVLGYLLQGLTDGKLTGEFQDLAGVAQDLDSVAFSGSKKTRTQKQLLKNDYLKGGKRELIVKFAEAEELAEYKAQLGDPPAKLAVFDFDQTLSTGHFKPPQTKPQDVLPDQRVGLLTDMLAHLGAKGAKVVVLTRNSAALVRDAWAARLPDPQQQVFRIVGQEACNHFDWCVYDNPGPSSKADAIKTLFLDKWGLGWDKVLFADDDPANCKDIKEKSGEQAEVLEACADLEWQQKGGRGPQCQGLTDELFQSVKAWADA